jgi:tetratricopeptide (TPR) repeat protein
MKSFKSTIFIFIIGMLPLLAPAQTLKDASDAYNEAAMLFSTDKESSVQLLEKALKICNSFGPEGDTIRQKIVGFLPGLYYELANVVYKDKKYEEAIPKIKKAAEVADLYKDELYQQRCTRLMANTYFYLGSNALKNNLPDTAVEYYQASIKLDPKAYKWFNISQIYLKKGNEEKMEDAMDKTLELAKTENDTASINKTNKLGRQYFYAQASAIQNKDGSKAIIYLDKAVRYDPKYADAYYMKFLIAYKLKRWQDAADAANLAIANETDPNELPKIYFKLGWTYVYLKKAPEACAAFKESAKSKDYVNEAKINMKNLQCN